MIAHSPRRRIVAALASLTLVSVAAPLAAQKEPFPGLDSYIAKAVADWKIPGVGVAIVRNDSVLYAKGFGVLAAGTKTPVDENTIFEIGSSSKAFTATLVAMLVSDGKMRWDERLTTYLPTFRMYDPIASAEVTVRDALSHRSGIARGELAWLGAGISRDEVLRRVRFLKPESPFRSRYSYQNMMVVAAGEAAAKAAGSTWEELVKQRIFTPLGMTSSVPVVRESKTQNIATPHGMDADTAFRKAFMNGDNIAPAGAIVSSPKDMAQWLRFHLGDGVFNGKRLASAAAIRETHTPQILIGGGAGGGQAADTTGPVTVFRTYGLGWMISDYRHQLMIDHGGNTEGSTAAVGMLPEQKFGVVVLANMQSAALPGLLMRYIFDRQLGAPMRDLSGEALARVAAQRRRADSTSRAQAPQRVAGAKPPFPLASYAGTYADSLYGEAVVTLDEDRLEMKRGDWHGGLEYWSGNTFRWNLPPGNPAGVIYIKFDATPDGRVTGLYFGIGNDVALMGRRGAQGGGRGGRGGNP
jgi:CubicO group peptidase (beta-lactamase class C family)